MTLQLPHTETRLPQEVETTIFRIVQESLTNIHRQLRQRSRPDSRCIRARGPGARSFTECEFARQPSYPRPLRLIWGSGTFMPGASNSGDKKRRDEAILAILQNLRGPQLP